MIEEVSKAIKDKRNPLYFKIEILKIKKGVVGIFNENMIISTIRRHTIKKYKLWMFSKSK